MFFLKDTLHLEMFFINFIIFFILILCIDFICLFYSLIDISATVKILSKVSFQGSRRDKVPVKEKKVKVNIKWHFLRSNL